MILYEWKSGCKVRIDLCNDYSNMIRDWFKRNKIAITATNEQDLWYGYFNLHLKSIQPKKRRIWYSKEFRCPQENQKGLQLLVKKFESGEDVSPYLNKISDKPDKFDPLLYDWGIYHFHLGEKKEATSKYIERTGPILLAKIDDDNAYFIQVYRHGKGVREQPWNKQEMVRILHENWPWCIEEYRVPDVVRMTEKISDSMHEQMRKNGMYTFVEAAEGAVYSPMGGGYASSGHSQQIVRYCIQIHNTLKTAELKIKHNLAYYLYVIEEHTHKKLNHDLYFILWDSGENYFNVVDLESHTVLMKVII